MRQITSGKIDPILLNSINIKSSNDIKVIVLATDYTKLKNTLISSKVQIVRNLPFINAYVINIQRAKILHLSELKQVLYICSDVKASTQMNIASKVIGADKLHRRGLTGKNIGVAIIDTGLYPHPDFIRQHYRIRRFIDLVNNKPSPYDDNGHGTFVTGVVAGSGYASRGRYKGIAPRANIISFKTMDKDGGGDGSMILEAMQYITDHYRELNIKVVSLSLGAVAGTKQSDILSKGAQAMWDRGIFVVAAAGNSGPGRSTITTPGINSVIMTVGASDDNRTVTTDDDAVASFSGRGPASRTLKPEIVAPGVNITSTNNSLNPAYTVMSGTSVSTPVVAGAAVLYFEAFRKITPDKIKALILKNAINLNEDKYAQGKGSIMLL